MPARLLLIAIALGLAAAAPSLSQIDDADHLLDDTTSIPSDSLDLSDTLSIADSSFVPISDNDLDLDLPRAVDFFTVRNGGFLGGLVEFSSLKPSDLDPRLSGNLVVYGGEGYVMFSGWLLGGIGTSAVLYDLPSTYDEFSFGYGGLLFGYDQQFARERFSFQIRSMAGLGGTRMIRKRPDLIDSTGLEILERVREESFFAFRPEVSVGFQPVGFLELRLGASYLAPVGSTHVGDLASFNYGISVLLSVTY